MKHNNSGNYLDMQYTCHVLVGYLVNSLGVLFLFLNLQYSSVLGLKALITFRGPDVNPVSAQGTPLDLAGININGTYSNHENVSLF